MSPDSLGASGKYIEVDLATAAYSLLFAPLFAAKYTDDVRFQAQAVSRTIVATGGSGSILLIGTRGEQTEWSLQESEANAIQATGVHELGDITSLKVML